jgi:hypothetical protein
VLAARFEGEVGEGFGFFEIDGKPPTAAMGSLCESIAQLRMMIEPGFNRCITVLLASEGFSIDIDPGKGLIALASYPGIGMLKPSS